MNSVVVIAAALIATGSVGGASRATRFEGCGDPNGGEIKGIARDEAGKPVAAQGLRLDGHVCTTITASDGTFLFRGVPPGVHTIRSSSWNYLKGPPVEVKVAAGVATRSDIRLHPANNVIDCMEEPKCAPLLKQDPAAVAMLSDKEKMREASTRMAYALTHINDGSLAGMAACIGDWSTAVTRVLVMRLPGGVPDSECGMSESGFSRKAHLIHKPSGKCAAAYYGGDITVIDASTFESHPSYYMNPLGAAWWQCRFVRKGTTWAPKFCQQTAVS